MRWKLAVVVLAAMGLQAQPAVPNADLKFEVASLKASPPETNMARPASIRSAPGGERYVGTRVTLKTMIAVAYRVRAEQVLGGPDWIDRDMFDMEAKAARPSSSADLHTMLKNLLADRFHLQFRRETTEQPAYVLTVDKGGPKLTAHEAENAGESRVELRVLAPLHIKVVAAAASMDYFAWQMGNLLDRPMLDRTGIQGQYDFTLAYTMEAPESMQPGMAGHNGQPIDFSGPTLEAALRNQMGLRLEKGKGPVEVFRIDRAEKPEGN